MLLPFTKGQITCYCPRKMLLPWRQITRRKLCFYYKCKFGVISIKYVIMFAYFLQGILRIRCCECCIMISLIIEVKLVFWSCCHIYLLCPQLDNIEDFVQILFQEKLRRGQFLNSKITWNSSHDPFKNECQFMKIIYND